MIHDIPTAVLITTANNPPCGVVQMTNSLHRIICGKSAVFFWASQRISNIVIADATSTPLLTEAEIELLGRNGVTVEQIMFQQDNDIVFQLGQGYAEGQLIKFAIENSSLLKVQERFFKCTGKLFVSNFANIYNDILLNNVELMFWRESVGSMLCDERVDTRFFYTTNRFFLDHLLPAYSESNARLGPSCEQTIYKLVNNHLKHVTAQRPIVLGFSGGFDSQYQYCTFGDLDRFYPSWVMQGSPPC